MTALEQARQLRKAVAFALAEFDKECKRIAGDHTGQIEGEVTLRQTTIHFNLVLFRDEIDTTISEWEKDEGA